MEPITIAALVAAVAGGGLQYKAAQDAEAAQARATQASIERQRALQDQAEGKAMEALKNYDAPTREANQQQAASQIEQTLAAPVSDSQAIRSQQQAVQGNVSDDFSAAKAQSDVSVARQAHALARLLGKTGSAQQLRLGEGVKLLDAGQGIDQLASFSRGQMGVDQLAINRAGTPDAGMMFFGKLLQAAGTAGLSGGGSGAAEGISNASNDPIASMNYLKGWTGQGNGAGTNFIRAFGG